MRLEGCTLTLIFKFVYSKKIQFGLLNAQDVVKLSEFQVTHRDLYTAVDRAPVKDGVLDRRLVSKSNTSGQHLGQHLVRVPQSRMLSVKRADLHLLIVSDITHI